MTSGFTVERAIVVDDQMRTDDPDVYAVGECAQHRGQVYGLVAPLWEQAKVLADHLTGHNLESAYHGSRTATKLKVAGVDVASMGITAPEREDDLPHFAAFFNAIRSGSAVPADIRIGATAALTAILGREAIYSGKLMTWEDLGVQV